MSDRVMLYGAGVALVALAALGWYAQRKVAALPAGSFDPTSRENLAYKGANQIGAALTGDNDFALGAWLWEVSHPGEVAAELDALRAPAAPVMRAAPDSSTPFWYGAP